MEVIKIKLPFGLNENNILKHIANVERGDKYFCPGCLVLLLAVKGNIKQHHFRHAVADECEHGLESAIHLFAKQRIMEEKQITLPEYVSVASAIDSMGIKHTEPATVVREGEIIQFDFVQDEKELQGMRADILAIKGNKSLIIEVFYRHKVDEQKIEKIKKANISAIEINLSELMPEDVKDLEAFWSYMNDPKHIQWLYNVKAHDSVYPKLENQLIVQIQQLEKEYAQQKLTKQRQEQKEKAQLVQALKDLEIFCSKEHIAQLNQEVEMHPLWLSNNEYLQLSLDELPNFLKLEVPNGDWIFGCDRRIWQTAFYNSFIRHKSGKHFFSIKRVNDWLKDKAMCKVPRCAEIIGIYGRRYPELVPAYVYENMPSSWATLRDYFNHLCELGMLKFSGNDSRHKGSYWFEIISKSPDAAYTTRATIVKH